MIPPFPQEATQNGKRKKSKKRVCCPRSHIWEGLSETQIQKCQTAHSVPFSKSTSSWMQLLTREGMIAQTVGGTDTDEIRGNREGVWPRLGHRQDTLLKRRGWEVGFDHCDSTTSGTIAIQQPLGSIPALPSRTSEGQPPALKTPNYYSKVTHFALASTLASQAHTLSLRMTMEKPEDPWFPSLWPEHPHLESQGHTRLWPAPSNSCFPLLCSKKQMPKGMVTVPRHRTAQPRRELPSGCWQTLGSLISTRQIFPRHKNRSLHAESSMAGRIC